MSSTQRRGRRPSRRSRPSTRQHRHVGDGRLARSRGWAARCRPSARRAARAVTSAGSTVATVVPRRITVISSATESTSSSLCEMKMTVRPSRLELAQVVEELVDLLRHQHRGRLVEDQDPRAAVEDLEDLDPLPVADAEVLDQRVRVDVQAVRRRQISRICARGAGRRCRASFSRAEDDVLEDGEVVGEHEVLVHHADAGARWRRCGEWKATGSPSTAIVPSSGRCMP